MLATVSSAVLLGVDGLPVTVEVHVGNGLPCFTIVGLPDASCREARDRVRAAVEMSGVKWPNRKITVNLAPSGHRKAGAGLDLAIAIGVLAAAEELPIEALRGGGFLGELGLDGSVRPVPGMVCLVDAIDEPAVIVPAVSADEASLVGRHRVRPVPNLRQLIDALRGDEPWPVCTSPAPEPTVEALPDLADVAGQPVGRRALEVAAAGGHHLLFVGPPGAGKTMLAERLAGVLPELSNDEALEVTRVHSAAAQRLPTRSLIRRPPLRAPHHGSSQVAIIGGGSSHLRPGEISLAAMGVLFLDEVAEFPAAVLDALRTPLEEGVVRIARAGVRATMPARFTLVAAMNPCPCGAAGGPASCRCTPSARARYARRLSGPLLDRFDLRLHLQPVDPASIVARGRGEPSAAVAERVAAARGRARARGVRLNATLTDSALDEAGPLRGDARHMLERAVERGVLSGRGVRRVRCVALTLADLAGVEPPLSAALVAEAIQLRGALATAERYVA